MKKVEETGNRGINIFSVMGLTFIVLKLTGQLSWSWWAILAPFWVPFGMVLIIMVLLTVFWICKDFMEDEI